MVSMQNFDPEFLHWDVAILDIKLQLTNKIFNNARNTNVCLLVRSLFFGFVFRYSNFSFSPLNIVIIYFLVYLDNAIFGDRPHASQLYKKAYLILST